MLTKTLRVVNGTKAKGGHIFTADPRPQVEGLLGSGTLKIERDGFFETPSDVSDRMFELVFPYGKVLEPSAGNGAIADRIPLNIKAIQCVERNSARAETLRQKGYVVFEGDFLTFRPPHQFDYIAMNPPFEEGQDIEHVNHAFTLLAPLGALISVMSEGVFFRTDRKTTEFRTFLHSVNTYIEKLPDHSFRSSGTDVATRLVVIRPSLADVV